MSEPFEAGQTVWRKKDGVPHTVVVQRGDLVWVCSPGRGNVVFDQGAFTDADPNQPAEPVPQNCPYCHWVEPRIEQPKIVDYYVLCVYCGVRGPVMPNRLEAITTWNSIRMASGIFDGPEYDKIEKVATTKVAVAEEREACIKVIEKEFSPLSLALFKSAAEAVKHIAEAIRKRGQ